MRLGIFAAALLLAAGAAQAQDQAPRREWQRTIAPASLQNELRPRVLAAASARLNDPACRRIAVADTSFNGWTGAPGRAWEETWIVDLCGRIADVLVQFAPGPDGVAADIPARSVHLRP